MDDPLASARLKLKRAELHRRTAEREARRFFKRHPDPTFRIEPEGELENPAVGIEFPARLVVETGYPQVPDSFAPRFGDTLHNYRSALDHIAWQLVSSGKTPPSTLTEEQRRKIQFPIYATSNSFVSNQGVRLPGVDKKIVRYIKARHKYIGGKATNNALLDLTELSNEDKHRTMQAFVGLFDTLQNQVTLEGFWIPYYANPPTRPTVKDGAVVALMRIAITAENPKMTMKLKPSLFIAIEDGRDFSKVLESISVEVRHFLEAPQVLAGIR